ncbi:FeS-binding protein [Desulfobacterales bacterium HSG2]|nr:FeS-binding protein [Desulfobacterales bacterium HSG2]
MQEDFFPERLIKRFYLFILFLMSITGFGQMPIFKRYYIADIPGLAWLANFYFTHYVHYIGAILLFAIFGYCIVGYLLVGRQRFRLTGSAYIRIVLLTAIAGTGIFRVLKNLPDIVFSPGFTMFVDISHLIFMMIFLLVTAVFLVMKTGWLTLRQ